MVTFIFESQTIIVMIKIIVNVSKFIVFYSSLK